MPLDPPSSNVRSSGEKPVVRVLLAALLGLAFGGLALHPSLRGTERLTYDLRARMVADLTPPADEIVVVGITNETLWRMDKAVGRFPWPRVIYAPIIDLCRGAKVLGIDILFSETESRFAALPPEQLLEFARDAGNVVSACHIESGAATIPNPLADHPLIDLGPAPSGVFGADHGRVVVPFPDLLAATKGVGHVTHFFDEDGVARRYSLVLPLQGRLVPSMALAMFKLGGGGPAQVRPDARLVAGSSVWRIDGEGAYAFVQPRAFYKIYDFADLLEAWNRESAGENIDALRAEFKDKYVLLGCLATGLPFDLVATPVFPQYPGVMVHAAALEGLLRDSRFVTPPAWVALLISALLAMLVALPETPSPMWKAGLSVVLLLAYAGVCVMSALAARWMIPVAPPLASLGGYAFLASMFYWRGDRRRRAELELLEQAKQQFTDMLVHDLKGRMGTMMTALEGLQDRLHSDDPGLRRSFTGIQSGGSRMLTQINALLDIRRMEEGAMRIEAEPVSINEQVGEAVRDHQGAAEVAGMTIEAGYDRTVTRPLLLDPSILQRIFANLLWNAILYGARGGVIQVNVVSRPDGVDVFVRNSGRVIPPEHLLDLYKPFTSIAAPGSNLHAVSSGLGLAFCRIACEAMGGTIHLHSPVRGRDDGVEVVLGFPFPESAGAAT
jgi:signal transduction histidine kinase